MSIITITLVIYLVCKHKHIRTIVTCLILHKAKEIEAKLTTETNNPECSTLAYIGNGSDNTEYGNSHFSTLYIIKIL